MIAAAAILANANKWQISTPHSTKKASAKLIRKAASFLDPDLGYSDILPAY
jgi:hypothetical protein